MKNNFLTAAVVCVVVTILFACGHEYQGKLVPMYDNSTNKWGFADTLGKIVISPQWDTVNDFFEGYAVVGLNNMYGYIDGKGIEKIPIKYDKAEPFSEGLSEVELDGKIGSIDTAGVIIIPFQHIGMETDSAFEVIDEFIKRFEKGEDFLSLCSVDLNETKVINVLEKYKSPGGMSVLIFNDNNAERASEVHAENVTKLKCVVIDRNSGVPKGIFSVVLLYNPKRNTYLITNI